MKHAMMNLHPHALNMAQVSLSGFAKFMGFRWEGNYKRSGMNNKIICTSAAGKTQTKNIQKSLRKRKPWWIQTDKTTPHNKSDLMLFDDFKRTAFEIDNTAPLDANEANKYT